MVITREKQTNIKWPIAKTLDGAYIKVEEATSGTPYQCPECAGRLIPRKGGVKRWHFAHCPGSLCGGEGARHTIAKHMIASMLGEIKAIPFLCFCDLATTPYRIDISDVKVENKWLDYRCDITCKVNKKEIFIEVVDTHPVPEEKQDSLGDNLVKIEIYSLTDKDIFQGITLKLLLEKGLGYMLPGLAPEHVFIHTWRTLCWKCHQETPVAIVCDNNRDCQMWAQSFPPEILSELRKHTKLKFRRTSLVKEGYMANVCSSCGATQGDYFLQGDLLDLLADGEASKIETVYVVPVKPVATVNVS